MLTRMCDAPRPTGRAGLKSRTVHRGQASIRKLTLYTRQSGRVVSKDRVQENMYQLVGGRTGCSQTRQHFVTDTRGRCCVEWFGYFITLYRLPWSCGSIELDANTTCNMTIIGEQLILVLCLPCTIGD